MTETTIKPISVRGKHNEALVYAKALERACENKIRQYLDHPDFADTTVRIMPDVHPGKTTVIGWTATYTSRIIPSVIGLDIGCGVCACNLGRGNLRFDKLDAFIRKNIPAGQDVRQSLHEGLDEMNSFAASGGGDKIMAVFSEIPLSEELRVNGPILKWLSFIEPTRVNVWLGENYK